MRPSADRLGGRWRSQLPPTAGKGAFSRARLGAVSSHKSTVIAPPSSSCSARSADTKNAPVKCHGAAQRPARQLAGASRTSRAPPPVARQQHAHTAPPAGYKTPPTPAPFYSFFFSSPPPFRSLTFSFHSLISSFVSCLAAFSLSPVLSSLAFALAFAFSCSRFSFVFTVRLATSQPSSSHVVVPSLDFAVLFRNKSTR
jgi:hypothetical protein